MEIGAQWIHGQQENPLFVIAKENGLIREGFENIISSESTQTLDDFQSILNQFVNSNNIIQGKIFEKLLLN